MAQSCWKHGCSNTLRQITRQLTQARHYRSFKCLTKVAREPNLLTVSVTQKGVHTTDFNLAQAKSFSAAAAASAKQMKASAVCAPMLSCAYCPEATNLELLPVVTSCDNVCFTQRSLKLNGGLNQCSGAPDHFSIKPSKRPSMWSTLDTHESPVSHHVNTFLLLVACLPSNTPAAANIAAPVHTDMHSCKP